MRFKVGDTIKFVGEIGHLACLNGKTSKITDIGNLTYGKDDDMYLVLDIDHPNHVKGTKVCLYDSEGHWNNIINLDDQKYKNYKKVKKYLGVSDE